MSSLPRLRRTFLILTTCTLAVFGALVFTLTANVRSRLRHEAEQRDAEMLHDVALMQISSIQARLSSLGVPLSPPDVFAAVLESSRLRGDLAVLGVQLFDTNGALRDAMPSLPASSASIRQWWPVPLDAPRARFDPRGSLDEVLGLAGETGTATTPLLDAIVPLRSESGVSYGIARYWIDGRALQSEFAAIDRSLLAQAGIAFLGGAILLGLLMLWTYRRLVLANEQLLARTADLARANEELDFAAKTGALGAISAHLIHGLKNPLAGLEGYVAEERAERDDPGGTARQTAVDTARRLRTLVNDVVAVLRDEATGEGGHPVPLIEAVQAVESRATPLAGAAHVKLAVSIHGEAQLKARTANLAALILANLLTNAIEASRRDGAVRLDATATDRGIVFLVTDSGPGLPGELQSSWFRPIRSTKPGGGGMGLAISHRLARHAGGELTLARTGPEGTTFQLVVPVL